MAIETNEPSSSSSALPSGVSPEEFEEKVNQARATIEALLQQLHHDRNLDSGKTGG